MQPFFAPSSLFTVRACNQAIIETSAIWPTHSSFHPSGRLWWSTTFLETKMIFSANRGVRNHWWISHRQYTTEPQLLSKASSLLGTVHYPHSYFSQWRVMRDQGFKILLHSTKLRAKLISLLPSCYVLPFLKFTLSPNCITKHDSCLLADCIYLICVEEQLSHFFLLDISFNISVFINGSET